MAEDDLGGKGEPEPFTFERLTGEKAARIKAALSGVEEKQSRRDLLRRGAQAVAAGVGGLVSVKEIEQIQKQKAQQALQELSTIIRQPDDLKAVGLAFKKASRKDFILGTQLDDAGVTQALEELSAIIRRPDDLKAVGVAFKKASDGCYLGDLLEQIIGSPARGR